MERPVPPVEAVVPVVRPVEASVDVERLTEESGVTWWHFFWVGVKGGGNQTTELVHVSFLRNDHDISMYTNGYVYTYIYIYGAGLRARPPPQWLWFP